MNEPGLDQPWWKTLREQVAGSRVATLIIDTLFPYYLAIAHSYLPVSVLRGCTRPHGRPGTLLVVGKKPWVDHLPGVFFAEQAQGRELGSFPIWALPSKLAQLQSSVDLTVIRVNKMSARLFFDKGFLHVPEAIEALLKVPEDPTVLFRAGKSVRSDLCKIRQNRLEPHFSREESDFEEFYRQMYLPYIYARHGKFAYGANRYRLRHKFHRGGILWVEQGGKRIAGMVLERRQQWLKLVALGTTYGDLAPVKQGALAAVYYFGIEYARQHGFTLLSLGTNGALLQDGILRYKRKWGAAFTESSDNHFDLLLRWDRFDGVVADFLSQTSPVFRESGGISAIHVMHTERPASPAKAKKAHKSLWVGGLHRLYLVSTAGWEAPAESPPNTVLMNLHEAGMFLPSRDTASNRGKPLCGHLHR